MQNDQLLKDKIFTSPKTIEYAPNVTESYDAPKYRAEPFMKNVQPVLKYKIDK